MQLHQLQPNHKLKGPKRVGRGGKKGTYSGKGGKGQTARSGRKLAPIIRELIKRYPKLKGYRRFVLENNIAVVNINLLEKHFKDGESVTPAALVQKGVVGSVKGRMPSVKILGRGELTRKITIENCTVSTSAKQAIEKVGGIVK